MGADPAHAQTSFDHSLLCFGAIGGCGARVRVGGELVPGQTRQRVSVNRHDVLLARLARVQSFSTHPEITSKVKSAACSQRRLTDFWILKAKTGRRRHGVTRSIHAAQLAKRIKKPRKLERALGCCQSA